MTKNRFADQNFRTLRRGKNTRVAAKSWYLKKQEKTLRMIPGLDGSVRCNQKKSPRELFCLGQSKGRGRGYTQRGIGVQKGRRFTEKGLPSPKGQHQRESSLTWGKPRAMQAGKEELRKRVARKTWYWEPQGICSI